MSILQSSLHHNGIPRPNPISLFAFTLASALTHGHVVAAGSVRAEEKQSASGRPEFSQELLQCFFFAQVRLTVLYYAAIMKSATVNMYLDFKCD